VKEKDDLNALSASERESDAVREIVQNLQSSDDA
jgi:hypothetical protein